MVGKKVNFSKEKFSCFTHSIRKKGLTVTIETVLLIILSIAVMTILIIFLATQTSFFKRFLNSQEDDSNIDVVVGKCNSLFNVDSKYSYCCEKRAVDFGNNSKQMTCDEFRVDEFSSGRIEVLDCAGVKC